MKAFESQQPSVDSECLELARHFLADTPAATDNDRYNLAATIQEAVEDWFYVREHCDSLKAMGADDES